MADTTILEASLERLHNALHRGERPELTSLLPPDAPALPTLLELVHADLDFRCKLGEPCRVEDYLERYPALRSDPEGVVGLVLAEAKFRRRQEPALSRQEYLARFPEYRAVLEARLTAELEADGRFPQVPGFEILAELGRGGMGVVYKARQVALGRLVALKMVMDGGALGGEEVSRLRVEAEAVAHLQHPNIVRLFEVGVHAGCSYLALEYVEGIDLEAYCGGRPLSPHLAAAVVETLAQAIDHAHRHGIIHRDLKPGNILLQTTEDTEDTDQSNSRRSVLLSVSSVSSVVKIADFGLARRLSADARLTHSGQVLGTPGYMAPEQAAGTLGEPGPAVDVYALGAILYALLCGTPPFRGSSALVTLRQQACEEPIPPRRLQPRTPRDLEVICLKCLAREPRRRYPSAQDLADDLRRFLSGEPITARPAGAAERVWKWARRRPAVAAVCVLAVLALGMGLAGLLWHTNRLQEALDLADTQRRQAKVNETAARDAVEQAAWNLYTADMRLGMRMLQTGDVLSLPALLERHQPRPGDPVERRGFEWWYLYRHARSQRPPLRAHANSLSLLAYSADGRALLTASRHGDAGGRFLKLWDLETGQASLHTLAGLQNIERDDTALAPGGRFVALRPDSSTVAICAAGDGHRLAQLPWPKEPYRLAFLDDSHLAIADESGVHLWPWKGGGEKAKRSDQAVHSHRAPVIGLPWGRQLALAGHGVEAWDWPGGQLAWWASSEQWVTALAPLPARKRLVAAQGTNPLLILNENGGVVARLGPWARPIQALAVSPDERTLAATEHDTVHFWDTASWRPLGKLRWQAQPIDALAWSPDGHEFAAATADGLVYRLDAGVPLVPEIVPPSFAAAGAVALTPDGRTVAAADQGGDVVLFDVENLSCRKRLPGDGGAVQALAFAPDGAALAMVSAVAPTLQCWDTHSGRCRFTMRGPAGALFCSVRFSPDRLTLAATDRSGDVWLWDAITGRERRHWRGGNAAVVAAAFAPDGHLLATAHGAHLRLWDLSALDAEAPGSGQGVPPLLATWTADGPVHSLDWSPDGRALAVGADRGLACWDVTEPQRPRRSHGPWGVVGPRWVQWSTDGRTLLGGDATRAWLVDTGSGHLRGEVACNLFRWGALTGAALSAAGQRLATVHADRGLRVWNVSDWRVRYPAGVPLGPVYSLGVLDTGGTLAAGHRVLSPVVSNRQQVNLFAPRQELRHHGVPLAAGGDGVQRWALSAGTAQLALPSAPALTPPDRIVVSPTGRHLAAGGRDGSVWVWELPSRQLVRRLFVGPEAEHYAALMELARRLVPATPEHPDACTDLTFAPDGSCLAAVAARGQVVLWDTTTWQGRKLAAPRSGRTWVQFLPDGTTLAVGTGSVVELWNTNCNSCAVTLGTEKDPASLCGAVSSDGGLLVSGGADRRLRVWDVAARRQVAELAGHLDRVTAVAFAPQGRTLASCGWDGTVRLWNIATWQEVASLEGHRGKVHAVAFAPEGRLLVSGGETEQGVGEILLWRAALAPR